MSEQEIRDKLESIQRGDVITVRDEVCEVSDVSDYTLGDFDWRNIGTKKGESERILEVFPRKREVRIWLPISQKRRLTPKMKTVSFALETFTRKEFGTAEVVISQTGEGPEKYEIDYSVLHAPSGHRLSVEDDGGDISIYYSNEVISLADIQIK